eukprot:Amastigsp_a4885_27.p4 type:complete len:122 gc:universal Amastigsp_a4885_27:1171-1536(+)
MLCSMTMERARAASSRDQDSTRCSSSRPPFCRSCSSGSRWLSKTSAWSLASSGPQPPQQYLTCTLRSFSSASCLAPVAPLASPTPRSLSWPLGLSPAPSRLRLPLLESWADSAAPRRVHGG